MPPRKPATPSKTGKPSRKKLVARKPNTSKSSTNPSVPAVSNLLSISKLGNLRNTTKQWLNYMQQADIWIDTLYSAGNTLNESGLLQKIIKQKGKNLSTGDFTAILMALMNTPLADRFLKGSGSSEPSGSDIPAAEQPTTQHPTAPAPITNSPPQMQQPQELPKPASPPHIQRPHQPGFGPFPNQMQTPGYWQVPGAYPGINQPSVPIQWPYHLM